ncbi:MAG: dihydroorotase [Ruminococcaceae bacterium]|nr:dihydroorotase [Oscillospiraceae bacterium]
MIIKGKVYQNGSFYESINIDDSHCPEGEVLDFSNMLVIPGLVDVHVHLREPGFSYKETIATGTAASARGGFTTVCSMPNLSPVPDSLENLKVQLDLIEKTAKISVKPYGAITKGEMGKEPADLSAMAPYVAAFSDDGRGVQDDGMMTEAMTEAKRLGKIIAAHCEVNSLLNGGYIHDGEYARAHGHRGISSESEWRQIERDINLAAKTGVKYHVCHISTKESVELIRQAKKTGVDITAETGPHYLVFNDMDLIEDARFKMNPPLRGEADRLALIEGITDGTIDMIATDHAPHSAEEKGRGLEKSAMGVVGIETALPVMYTYLVKTGIITLEKLIELMSINPRKRFELPGGFENGDFTVVDLAEEFTVNPDEFLSMGRATPFEGMSLCGRVKATVCGGKIVYDERNNG